LILQIDSQLTLGSFMSRSTLRSYSHDLNSLFDAVDGIAVRRCPADPKMARPVDPIHGAILDILSGFAINGRYRHLDHLGGHGGLPDAAEQWLSTVIEAIAPRHYSDAAQARDQAKAAAIGALLSGAYLGRQTLVD
jgi:hypothetical protein